IDDSTVSDWDEVLAVNTRGTFLAMQAAHGLLAATGGAVVNVASVHAQATSVGAASYASSKAAVVALSRAAAVEWSPHVRVNAVLPGSVDTQMLRQGLERWAAPGSIASALASVADRTPLKRIGRPDEIAQAVLFLADGERSSFITGQTLVVDGGVLARLSSE
ncbi:MAG: SDR family oxidoreductase, partial [Candidatus Limnocylindria bacterium]